MKIETILTQIQKNNNNNRYSIFDKKSISNLINILKMLKDQSDLILVNRSIEKIDGTECERFECKTERGRYVQNIPLNCDLHTEFLNLFRLQSAPIAKETPILSLCFSPVQIKLLKKIAASLNKFTHYPNIQFKTQFNTLSIAATDGYKLITEKLEFVDNLPAGLFYVDYKHLKSIKKPVINFYAEKYEIDNCIFDMQTNFPDYKCIWPDYQDKIVIFKHELLDSIKKVSVTCDKVTKAIKLQFDNGKLKISSKDEHFGLASDSTIYYKGSNCFEILFNSDYLKKCIDLINDDLVIFNHKNQNNPVLINNSILLMPCKE